MYIYIMYIYIYIYICIYICVDIFIYIHMYVRQTWGFRHERKKVRKTRKLYLLENWWWVRERESRGDEEEREIDNHYQLSK